MLSDFSDSDMLLARDFFEDDGSWRSWAVDAAFLLFCIGGISPNLVAMEQRVTEKSDERGGAISSKSARKRLSMQLACTKSCKSKSLLLRINILM